MVLEVLFWILLILSGISAFLPDTVPYTAKSRLVVIFILLAILGLKAFNSPLTK